MKQEQPHPIRNATPDDVRAALLGLSAADSVRLKQIAKLRASGTRLEWSDLLNEAFARALAGQRQWPLGVAFAAFIAQTMRSIAHDDREAQEVVVPMGEAASGETALRNEGELIAVSDLTPERQLSARQTLGQIEAIFADDPVALAVLVATAEERSPESIQAEQGLLPTQYASALRKIRRRLQSFRNEE